MLLFHKQKLRSEKADAVAHIALRRQVHRSRVQAYLHAAAVRRDSRAVRILSGDGGGPAELLHPFSRLTPLFLVGRDLQRGCLCAVSYTHLAWASATPGMMTM